MECAQTLPRMFLVGGVRLKVKQDVKESGGCVKFCPQGGARQRISPDILYATTSDSDSDSDQLWFYIKLLHSVSTLNL